MSSGTNPVRGITAENFVNIGKAFMGANNGVGFIIALKPYPGFPADTTFHPTPRQWGAWMSYWSRIPYRTKAMQERGYATTPTEWPHEFDANATFSGDQAAADAFELRWNGGSEIASRRTRPRKKFTPYPKLWNALADSPDLLKALEAMTFDGMTDISKTMAVEGIEAAKVKLRRLASMPERGRAA